jgi:hypothetical protein
MSKVGASLIIFFLGLFLGWGTAATTANDMMQTGQQVGIGGGPNESASEEKPDAPLTHLTLNNLFREHGVLASLHLQAIYDGKSAGPTSQMLETNGQQIASIIGSVYGAQARSNFLTMWREHINQYEEYTKALKSGNRQKMNETKANLETNASEMGKMMNQISPNISQEMMASLTREHANLTLSIIDAYAARNQEEYINEMKAAGDQASRYADYLFRGMRDGRPESFR